jgi:hypothetical protein
MGEAHRPDRHTFWGAQRTPQSPQFRPSTMKFTQPPTQTVVGGVHDAPHTPLSQTSAPWHECAQAPQLS